MGWATALVLPIVDATGSRLQLFSDPSDSTSGIIGNRNEQEKAAGHHRSLRHSYHCGHSRSYISTNMY